MNKKQNSMRVSLKKLRAMRWLASGSVVFSRFFFSHTKLAQNFRSAAFFVAMTKKVKTRAGNQLLMSILKIPKHTLIVERSVEV